MTGGLSSTSSTSVVIEIVIDTKLEEVRFFFLPPKLRLLSGERLLAHLPREPAATTLL